MKEIFEQLGIDWKLFLSQLLNFFVLLVILKIFVYKPLLNILRERKKRIEEGLSKAKEADERLKTVDEIGKKKLKEAENKGVALIAESHNKAKKIEEDLTLKAHKKEEELLKKTEVLLEGKKEEFYSAMQKDVVDLVKQVIAKTVALSPEKIDDILVKKAISYAFKKEK